ncbi:hypothetical protein M501DRAFT_620531 [Patellaria atrata CBS 101060]|uniref:Carboxylesterase family protein n=1 Tax=Patellaria atrata CBS 101060 TaxID=1346257 RepID=A0A9P4SDD3_9PEZI|nr:hypothetical protein M501DRAFT_620531 [Patellaria atrata CBS 101060]
MVQVPIKDERSVSPPARSVRLTRRQLAKQEEDLANAQMKESVVSDSTPEIRVDEPAKDEVDAELVAEVEVQPTPIRTIEEPKTLVSEKLTEEPMPTSPIEQLSVRSPSRSPTKSTLRLEESIDAIDALEEAIEEVGKALPSLDSPTSPKKPRKKTAAKAKMPAKPNTAGKIVAAKQVNTNSTVRKAPVPRAPVSLKESKPRPTKASLARASNVRHSISTRITSEERRKSFKAQADAKKTRHPGLASEQVEAARGKGKDICDLDKVPGEPTDYLASRRRPISLSFPTPPPPPKSKKAPTKSTFTLPGEAVAAKLKAQREERLKRDEKARKAKEEEKNGKEEKDVVEEKKDEVIVAVKEMKKPLVRATKAPVVRTTAASRARESLMRGELPSERTSAIGVADGAAAKRASIISTGANTAAPLRPKPAPNSSKSRTASNTTSNSLTRESSASTTADKAAGERKAAPASKPLTGKAIFKRDKVEKEDLERKRKEKEEAARKARAEAAERGRVASREWAERMKRKMEAKKVKEAPPAAEGEGAKSDEKTMAEVATVEMRTAEV